MSSEHPPEMAPMDPFTRRQAVKASGLTQIQIATVLDVDQGLVSRVIAGQRSGRGKQAWRIMHHIAAHLKLPLATVFPEAERRRPFVGGEQSAA
jgi:transcriptional regulator with XRE-family HTH domain